MLLMRLLRCWRQNGVVGRHQGNVHICCTKQQRQRCDGSWLAADAGRSGFRMPDRGWRTRGCCVPCLLSSYCSPIQRTSCLVNIRSLLAGYGAFWDSYIARHSGIPTRHLTDTQDVTVHLERACYLHLSITVPHFLAYFTDKCIFSTLHHTLNGFI